MGSNSSMLLVEHMFQTKGCIPSVVDKQPQGHHLPQQKVVGPRFFQRKAVNGAFDSSTVPILKVPTTSLPIFFSF